MTPSPPIGLYQTETIKGGWSTKAHLLELRPGPGDYSTLCGVYLPAGRKFRSPVEAFPSYRWENSSNTTELELLIEQGHVCRGCVRIADDLYELWDAQVAWRLASIARGDVNFPM